MFGPIPWRRSETSVRMDAGGARRHGPCRHSLPPAVAPVREVGGERIRSSQPAMFHHWAARPTLAPRRGLEAAAFPRLVLRVPLLALRAGRQPEWLRATSGERRPFSQLLEGGSPELGRGWARVRIRCQGSGPKTLGPGQAPHPGHSPGTFLGGWGKGAFRGSGSRPRRRRQRGRGRRGCRCWSR